MLVQGTNGIRRSGSDRWFFVPIRYARSFRLRNSYTIRAKVKAGNHKLDLRVHALKLEISKAELECHANQIGPTFFR